MAANSGFPLSLDVKGYPVLVLGGDEEAAEKTQRLLEAGAKVTVVAPTLHDDTKRYGRVGESRAPWAAFSRCRFGTVRFWCSTWFAGTGIFPEHCLRMRARRSVLLWSVDQPEFSTVTMPAVVACGHLRVAISTSGVAPALSGFMKEDMEKIFGEEFAAFVEWLGRLREQTKATEPDFEKRRTLLREALDGFRLLGKVQYPKVWLDERAAKT